MISPRDISFFKGGKVPVLTVSVLVFIVPVFLALTVPVLTVPILARNHEMNNVVYI